MTKVLIIAGDGVEAQEIFYPYWRLKEEGIEVHVATPSKKEALFTAREVCEAEKFSYHGPGSTTSYTERHNRFRIRWHKNNLLRWEFRGIHVEHEAKGAPLEFTLRFADRVTAKTWFVLLFTNPAEEKTFELRMEIPPGVKEISRSVFLPREAVSEFGQTTVEMVFPEPVPDLSLIHI